MLCNNAVNYLGFGHHFTEYCIVQSCAKKLRLTIIKDVVNLDVEEYIYINLFDRIIGKKKSSSTLYKEM